MENYDQDQIFIPLKKNVWSLFVIIIIIFVYVGSNDSNRQIPQPSNNNNHSSGGVYLTGFFPIFLISFGSFFLSFFGFLFLFFFIIVWLLFLVRGAIWWTGPMTVERKTTKVLRRLKQTNILYLEEGWKKKKKKKKKESALCLSLSSEKKIENEC